MSDDRGTPGVDYIVTRDDITAVDFEGPLNDSASVDCHDLNQAFERAVKEGIEPERPVFQLLAGLTNYHFQPESRIEPFRPMMIMEGRRSLIPADFLADQIDVLAEIAPTITNHGLRARVHSIEHSQQCFLSVPKMRKCG